MVRYSYTYIESSIRNGVLEELEDHAVGPQAGTVRSVGSTLQPVRKKRTPFTAEDERVLYRWVDTYRQKGGATDGNEIYKQLEVEVKGDHYQTKLRRVTHKHLERTAHLAVLEGSLDQMSERQSAPSSHASQRSPNTSIRTASS